MGAESTSDLFRGETVNTEIFGVNILRFTILFGFRFCSGMDWLLAVWRQALCLSQTQGLATHRVCLKTAQLLH